MASVCDGDEIEFVHIESMIDERELTLAGRDFSPPQFSPIRRSPLNIGKTARRHSEGYSAAPDVEVAPEIQELDLESTLVPGKSFLSSNPTSKSSSDEDRCGISSSYMQAVTGGRLSDSSVVHQVSLLICAACLPGVAVARVFFCYPKMDLMVCR